jgi:ATP adenylyltransferase/5',5'''-P-1,P-4-tetraphosphate phosphorylase II
MFSTGWTANLASTANQFRALEEDEIMFLDSVRERQEEEERQRKQRDGEEIKSFRESVINSFNIML